MQRRLGIIGAGISGAYLAYLLTNEIELEIVIYDYDPYYKKPCGEVVPARIFKDLTSDAKKLLLQYTTRGIRRFKISMNNTSVAEIEATRDIWYVIDKQRLVLDLRRKAIDKGARLVYKYVTSYQDIRDNTSIIVDARGPFTNSVNPKVPVYNAILECNRSMDTVYLNFNTKTTGFAWVFPSHKHGTVNIGGGYLKVPRNLKKHVLTLLSEIISDCRVVRERGSLITLPLNKIEYSSITNNKLVLRVGEALGLVYPTTGEGIRPSLYSAECLARTLQRHHASNSKYIVKEYRKCLRNLVSNIKLHASLLKWVNRLGDTRIFNKVSHGFVYDYLSADLGYKSVFFELGRLLIKYLSLR